MYDEAMNSLEYYKGFLGGDSFDQELLEHESAEALDHNGDLLGECGASYFSKIKYSSSDAELLHLSRAEMEVE